MGKQNIKRLAYGFSALAMGLSSLALLPTFDAHASTGGDFCTVDDPSACYVSVSAPESLQYSINMSEALVFTGEFNGDLVVQIDGETYTGEMLEVDASDRSFTLNFETEEEGEHTVRFLITEAIDDPLNDRADASYTVTAKWIPLPYFAFETEKMVNVGDSFTVEALAINISKYEENGEGIWTLVDASEDEIKTTAPEVSMDEEAMRTFTLTALKPGDYVITKAIKTEDNEGGYVYISSEMYLTVADVRDEAARTIIDAVSKTDEAINAYADESIKYYKATHDGDDEAAEVARAAAKAAYDAISAAQIDRYNVFGDWENQDAIMEAVYDGKTITTDVSVEKMVETDVADEVKTALESEFDITFNSDISYYDIDVNVYADGELVGTLKELTNDQVIVISGFSGPSAGFNRVFQVVRYHTYIDGIDEDGNPIERVEVSVIDDVDFDATAGTITFTSDKFSTYAVKYKDVLAASVDAGAFTGEGASASASVSVSVMVAVVAAILAGAFKFAKRR